MMRVTDFISKNCQKLLENKQRAIIYAVILSVLPFASWLSVALVSLLSLRKGAKSGFEVMLPALVIHSVPLMMLMPVGSAIINTLSAYLPCYVAALSLRKTAKWQMVCGAFFIQALLCCLLIHWIVPELIVDQFSQFKSVLNQYQLINNSAEGLSSGILPQLFFGIQTLSVIVSAMISLMFARSIQAKLFLPGGFGNELLEFRSGRLAFLVLIAVSWASYYELPVAINLLPVTLGYFLISGFALAYCIGARKRSVKVFILLVLLILLKPTFVLFAYIVLGALDSLFNFRVYLPERVREST